MSFLKCAVIGAGYLGRFHAQKVKSLENAALVGIAESDPLTCQKVADELQVPGVLDYRDLLPQVDCVSIVTPTQSHFEIAKDCLQKGIHVLLEKPMTVTVAQANTLIAMAHQKKCKLQIGHLERFNPAFIGASNLIDAPLFIEASRLAPFGQRGTDVSVVLDLMIHDIDLIQTLVKSPIVHIDAVGSKIFSKTIDIASVRIHFANHCIANLSASRVSAKTERRTCIYQLHNYVVIDYHQKQCSVFPHGENTASGLLRDCVPRNDERTQDALLEEIKSFIQAIQEDLPPIVTGEDGRDALATAQTIEALIKHHHQLFQKEYA